MDMFARALAPIGGAAWDEIDAQAKRTLSANLSARRFVDVKGPYGWDKSCVFEGRLTDMGKAGEVGFAVRQCIRLVESRIDFELGVMELHNIERGSVDPDLVAVEKAAKSAAAFEDKAVYEGLKKAGFKGMKETGENKPVDVSRADPEAFLRAIVDETYRLGAIESIEGPYAIVGGRTMLDTLAQVVSGRSLFKVLTDNTSVDEYVYSPACEDAFLVSKRGGDLELTLGGDFSIGYTERKGDVLRFFLTESFAFRVIEPRAFTVLNLK